jgi:DNA (cytosine-5)-methyltransferase 1
MRDDGRPTLLDAFCGAGGATRGYQLAGFHVTGVDVKSQPRYVGDAFIRADALEVIRELGHRFDAIHASPPCQAYIRSGMVAKDGRHPALVPITRRLLEETGRPYVIENVPGSPLRVDLLLCGSMFGLGVRRHRWFEGSPPLSPWTASCNHSGPITGVYGHPHGRGGAWRNGKRPMLPSDAATWGWAMGIGWMHPTELALAIPPAYTELVGRLLLEVVR